MSDLIKLDITDLGFALGLMAITIGLSIWEKLGLELNLVIAGLRSFFQLVVLAYVLDFVFATDNVWVIGGFFLVMLTITAIVARNRISTKVSFLLPLVWITIFVSTSLILIYINFLIIKPDRWYEPRYLIPISAILLANAMNAAAVAGERLVSSIRQFPQEIETHLSLGATPQQAIGQYRRDAIRTALFPTLNQMMLMGMVTIPTFSSGQLLTGISPLEALSYQILIVFMVVLVNLLTAILITKYLYRQFFNDAMQLLK
ncbi:ABC transporter permease [Cylindrospermopsis raciborskii]|uniref:Iron export ABC transporter permease subunit FetB n=1 Tax=Cylindrospermopsis raciborskii CENA302 TaxID=1170768 RepID=A0A9Q5W7A4_9CYAN|nr:iron export ABC transporter permease subunit FetB [Cylindrospermopsis raciborskii]OPH08530.1 iron export ABC transporter permease subunit FetB [Cylindrospermopsis raciborskii CENA302]